MLEDKELDDIILNKKAENTSEVKSAEQTETKEQAVITDTITEEDNRLPDKTDAQSLVEFKNSTLNAIVGKFNSGEIDVDEGLKQFVNAVAIVEAVQDDKLKNELTKNAAKSLKSYTKSITYKDEEKKLNRKTSRNEAFYKAFRPILEFDLSHLIGKKRKRIVERDPQTGKKIVKYEDVADETPKTYADRSYGLCLMMVMIALFIAPYCVCNIMLAVFNGINALFECFNKFGRTAFYLCTSIAGIAIIGLIIYVLLLVIQAAFGVQIFA